jgi:CDP-diacylglycerol---glycerol-3-phosphate 3-phosphatidyltransferase
VSGSPPRGRRPGDPRETPEAGVATPEGGELSAVEALAAAADADVAGDVRAGDVGATGDASPAEAAAPEAAAPEADKPVPVGLINVANILTVARIFLVPVFVFCLVQGGTGWRLAALAAFGGASLTDFLDGQLARKRGLVTDFGKIADPIADKALTGAALITLSAIGELPVWVTVLILVRELGITALRFAVIRRGVIAASQGGKLKTLLQIIAICLYVLPPSFGLPALVKEVVMGAALVVTLVTGADYVVRAIRLMQKPVKPA